MGRTRLVALAALVAALAAGCDGAPTAKFVPPSSSSAPSDPTTTSAADVTPPVMPDLAKQHTVAGAKAFVEYYFETANYALVSLDAESLVELGASSCDGCAGGTDFIRKVARNDGTIHGGATSVDGLRVRRLLAAGRAWMTVDVRMHAGPQVIRYATRPTERYPGGDGNARLTLSPTAGGWRVEMLEVRT